MLLMALLHFSSYVLLREPSMTSKSIISLHTNTVSHKMSLSRFHTFDNCSSIVKLRKESFAYNLSTENAAAKNWGTLDLSSPKAREHLRGRIIIDRGSDNQTSDINASLHVRSNSELDVEHVIFQVSNSSLQLEYTHRDASDLHWLF
jgi:hypothetical protein